ncbi:Protein of unknown function [Cotesia congregata]|uniref:Uncharacterized protein n=1 Tax=Cotesia congregata TaxID=51543 RepID=A0A8J2MGV2_COTCN|nr:Protein of unknown function [Cotesia congregata]
MAAKTRRSYSLFLFL